MSAIFAFVSCRLSQVAVTARMSVDLETKKSQIVVKTARNVECSQPTGTSGVRCGIQTKIC